jgi:hypothetical protein
MSYQLDRLVSVVGQQKRILAVLHASLVIHPEDDLAGQPRAGNERPGGAAAR